MRSPGRRGPALWLFAAVFSLLNLAGQETSGISNMADPNRWAESVPSAEYAENRGWKALRNGELVAAAIDATEAGQNANFSANCTSLGLFTA
jgi:hypothetical protein